KNLTFIINILLDNNYPLNFIFDTVNQRIKNLIKNKYTVHNDLTDNVCANETASWLTVPYISLHTEKEWKKCFENWFERMQKCIDFKGECFEKQ
ncbi:hypothetical protein ALC56_05576, partial [Trachymyrmex septentrionalis]